MEIEVGDWIRSKDGFIGKVQKISYDNMEGSNYYICEKDNVMASNYLENIAMHSKNIIDLVEVGDYVNGHKIVSEIWGEDDNDLYFEIEGGFYKATCIGEKDIKTIVTKEQMASIEYKV